MRKLNMSESIEKITNARQFTWVQTDHNNRDSSGHVVNFLSDKTIDGLATDVSRYAMS